MKIPGQLDNVEPLRLAQHGSRLSGVLMVGELARVTALLFESEPDAARPNAARPDAARFDAASSGGECGEGQEGRVAPTVAYDLRFGIDENRQMICSGHLKVALQLQCQRCMGGVMQEVDSDFVYAFVTSDEKAALLPASYDPVVFDGHTVDLRDVLEDEILLALPNFPMHEPGACTLGGVTVGSDETPGDKRRGPFADLQQLLTK